MFNMCAQLGAQLNFFHLNFWLAVCSHQTSSDVETVHRNTDVCSPLGTSWHRPIQIEGVHLGVVCCIQGQQVIVTACNNILIPGFANWGYFYMTKQPHHPCHVIDPKKVSVRRCLRLVCTALFTDALWMMSA